MTPEYLVETLREMRALLRKASAYPSEAQGHLTYAALLACDTLTDVVNDPEFFSGLDRLATNRQQNSQAVDQTLLHPDQFEQFIEYEREVLIRYGVEASLVDYLCDEVKDVGPNDAKSTSVEEHAQVVVDLEEVACALATAMWREQEPQPRRTVLQLFTSLGGVTTTVGNVLLDAGIVTISLGALPLPVFTAVSGAVGTNLSKASVGALQLWDKYRLRRTRVGEVKSVEDIIKELREHESARDAGSLSVDEIRAFETGADLISDEDHTEGKKQNQSPVRIRERSPIRISAGVKRKRF